MRCLLGKNRKARKICDDKIQYWKRFILVSEIATKYEGGNFEGFDTQQHTMQINFLSLRFAFNVELLHSDRQDEIKSFQIFVSINMRWKIY
jgi:hypothetical protein